MSNNAPKNLILSYLFFCETEQDVYIPVSAVFTETFFGSRSPEIKPAFEY